MSKEFTFKQAVFIAVIPALISAASVFYARQADNSASNVELMQSITQARITERDLIQHEATKKGMIAYLVPVSDNRAWANYYLCRTQNQSRFECAQNQKQIIPKTTPEIISKRLVSGYD